VKPAAIALVITCAALAAGCGSSAAQHLDAHKPATAAGSPAVTPSPAVSDTATANEQAFANWLAAPSRDGSLLLSTISGPAMRDYVEFEALFAQALAADGQPLAPETVTTIPGGYQLCETSSNGSPSCDSFTEWQTGAKGRITDLAVDGQLILPRLGAGKLDTGSPLAISDVLAYRPGNSDEVDVVYKVRNVSDRVFGNGNPAWLAVFDASGGGEIQEDESNSVIPGDLQPGESAVELVAFATRTVSGEFSLRTNDQLETVLTTSALQTP
jgi:hypothetical protein